MTVVIHPDGQLQINGRWLSIGSEVSIDGVRGRFRYQGYSYSSAGRLVLNFIGGTADQQMMRSFYPEQVRTVHNRNKRTMPPRLGA